LDQRLLLGLVRNPKHDDVAVALAGGAGGPVMDAPEAFGIVYDPIETLAYVAAQTSRSP
jgi:hypothetical protein